MHLEGQTRFRASTHLNARIITKACLFRKYFIIFKEGQAAMALEAPTVDARTRIPEEIIQELINRIASHFHPEKIILFGSYAYGNQRPERDVALLVIMNTDLREIEQALQIRKYVNPLFGVNILVYSPSRLAQ
jgi:predicted nucleotidyltransferase